MSHLKFAYFNNGDISFNIKNNADIPFKRIFIQRGATCTGFAQWLCSNDDVIFFAAINPRAM